MPVFVAIALAGAVICTAGLALPLAVLVILALVLRRPPVAQDHLAIATLPGPRCTPVDIHAP